jgi:hypothetical protein
MPYPGERVQVDMMMRGFTAAKTRFDTAAELPGSEPAYFGLFEALNWAIALDDVIGEIWQPEGEAQSWEWRKRIAGAEVLIGVRYVRNLVHHHWARALRFEPVGGRPHWVWPASGVLPPPIKREQWAVPFYDDLLAGNRAADTLHSVDAVFATVSQFLVRPRPPA